MRCDANKETFEVIEIAGVTVLFTNARIDRKTVPDGLYCYSARETTGFSGVAATLEPFVSVNHWGTVLSKQEFPMVDGACELNDDDIYYLDKTMTLEEYMGSKCPSCN